MKKHCMITIKIILFFALWLVAVIVSTVPPFSEPAFLNANPALLRLWWEFLPLIGILLATVVFVFVVEKGNVKIRLAKNLPKATALGVSLGFVWLAGTILPLLLTGTLALGAKNTVPFLAVWFVSVLLNAIMQELLVRGYVFSLLRDKYNLTVATVVTTIFFTAMHAGAFEAGVIAVFNVITMSVFVTLLLVYTKNLLASILAHFIWNAVGRLVFGVVSLAEDYPSLWNGVLSGNAVVTGGTAKLEGSIVVSIVNVLLVIFMIYWIKTRDKQV